MLANGISLPLKGDFGVKSSHFVAFGDALIWSLEKQFGAAFTPELKEAWIELYRNVQSEMLRVAV